MKNLNAPGAAQGRAFANIDRALEELTAREIPGGAPLDRIEALVADPVPGSVDDIDFEAVESSLRDGSHLAVRDTPERRLDADRADAGAEPTCSCGAEPARKGRKKNDSHPVREDRLWATAIPLREVRDLHRPARPRARPRRSE